MNKGKIEMTVKTNPFATGNPEEVAKYAEQAINRPFLTETEINNAHAFAQAFEADDNNEAKKLLANQIALANP